MSAIVRHHSSNKRASTLTRFFRRKTTIGLESTDHHSALTARVKALEEEVALLTSYSSDTIYRLRYSTMEYEYISSAIGKLLGFTPDEVKSLNFRSLIRETRLITNGMKTVHSFEELERKRQLGDVSKWQADYLMHTKDGKEVWVSDISYPWLDENGEVIGSVGCLRDISERIEAEMITQEELIRLSHTDPLTNLANRREFYSHVETEIKRVQRSRADFSILLIDMDYFKKINDVYGHKAGDQVLIEVAGIITSCLRQTDLPARIGGEEFGVFLPDTPGEGAYYVADRICNRIRKHVFKVGPNATPISCTVSIGVSSSCLMERNTCSELFEMAGTRLYIAKHTGRNQVSVDEIVQRFH